MPNVTVRTKLLGGFAAILVVMVVVGVLAIAKLGSVGASTDEIAGGTLPRLTDISRVDAATMDYRGVEYAYLAQPSQHAELAKQLRGRASEVDATFAAFMKVIADEKDRVYGNEVRSQWAAYRQRTAPVT